MRRYRVLVSDTLGNEGLELLRRSPSVDLDNRPGLDEAVLAAAVAGADALVIRSGSKVTARVIEAADRLRVIGRAGIGVDNVDLPAASRRGSPHSSGGSVTATAPAAASGSRSAAGS